MGWSVGFDVNWKRDIGYGVPAICDHPDCNEKIDRGLTHVCGSDVYGGERGCGLFFCSTHLTSYMPRNGATVCARFYRLRKPYTPKPDLVEWIAHKLTDESWQEWRNENPQHVERLKSLFCIERTSK